MGIKNIKRYLPVTISIAAFISLFVIFIMQNKAPEIDVQLSPRHSAYFDQYGKPELYSGQYISKESDLINVRVNNLPGVSEPRIISNPIQPGVFAVVTNDFSAEGTASMFLTNDDGMNWRKSLIPLSMMQTNDMYYADPWADYDSKGNLAYVTVAMRNSVYSRKIVLNISKDNGQTWLGAPVTVRSVESEGIKLDKPKLRYDKDNALYVVWIEEGAPEGKVFFSVSRDGGKSFSEPMEVAAGEIEYADIHFDGDKTYIIYTEDRNELKLISSSDKGSSWSEQVKIAEYKEYDEVLNKQRVIKSEDDKGVRVNSDPQTVISDGKLFLTYAGLSEDGGEHSEAFFVVGDLNSMQFSEPRSLNESAGTDRFLPAILKDNNGTIHILYYTSQNDPENIMTEVHLASTNDMGNTFTYKNLSTERFNPYDIVVDGSYMGDYISLAVNNGKLIGVWTDGRNESMDVMAGIINLK